MQDYKQFNVYAIPFNVDLLSGFFWNFEILGINELEDFLSIFVNESSPITIKDIENSLNKLIDENLIETYKVNEQILENQNWNAEWESKINVIEVSDRIVIKPSFRDYVSKPNQIIITIDPKMSFGTGEHETTKLMLKLLDKYIKTNDTILDVGSGTSVLGIAASKLGASQVISVDNDEWCFINGKENIEKNDVNNVQVLNGTIDIVERKNFHIVLANINKNVLIEIKNKLYEKTVPSGLLILSGILNEDLDDIKRQFTPLGLTAIEYIKLNNWIGIVFKKL